ncbi:hypothetical protein HJC23_010349 [Cyclotella cryptica]|uniref:Zinc finger GRF-type domain-containing protein n=1 Tax=Cyclotella cryptica TaxID=29204 RepID=A0ABD3QVD8_9STRA
MSNPFTKLSLTTSTSTSTTTTTTNPNTLYAITSNPNTHSPQGNNNHNNVRPFNFYVPTPDPISRDKIGSVFPPQPPLWVGHNSAGSGRSPKDDFIFLLSSPSSSLSSSSNENHGNTTKWKVRPPKPLSCTPQSMAVSPHGGRGRYVVFSCTDGNCYLYRWMDSNNLLRV